MRLILLPNRGIQKNPDFVAERTVVKPKEEKRERMISFFM